MTASAGFPAAFASITVGLRFHLMVLFVGKSFDSVLAHRPMW